MAVSVSSSIQYILLRSLDNCVVHRDPSCNSPFIFGLTLFQSEYPTLVVQKAMLKEMHCSNDRKAFKAD